MKMEHPQIVERCSPLRIVLVVSRDRSSYGPQVEPSGAGAFPAKADLDGDALARLLQ